MIYISATRGKGRTDKENEAMSHTRNESIYQIMCGKRGEEWDLFTKLEMTDAYSFIEQMDRLIIDDNEISLVIFLSLKKQANNSIDLTTKCPILQINKDEKKLNELPFGACRVAKSIPFPQLYFQDISKLGCEIISPWFFLSQFFLHKLPPPKGKRCPTVVEENKNFNRKSFANKMLWGNLNFFWIY